jgi:TonB family protein
MVTKECWLENARGKGLAISPAGFICPQEGMMKMKVLVALTIVAVLGVAVSAQEGKRAMKSQGKPAYPELAKRMNVAGSVKVEVVVAANGTVKSAKALGGHPLLIDSAITAAKNTKYEPAAEETKELITYNFSNGN